MIVHFKYYLPLISECKPRRLSILRWSGSKARLIPELRRFGPASFKTYVEPFAGSACLFFDICPDSAILGDINPCVIDVYKAIASDPIGVADLLESIPLTSEAFYKLRSVLPSSLNLIERAARFIFLMKACFNGVYRTNKNGIFNVPMGNRVYALPTRSDLIEAAALLQRTQLVSGDFRSTTSMCSAGDWVYMDPPYLTPGRYRGEYGYGAEFTASLLEELVIVASNLVNQGVQVMISYQFDELLIAALPNWTTHEVVARRSVGARLASRGAAKELILTSYRNDK